MLENFEPENAEPTEEIGRTRNGRAKRCGQSFSSDNQRPVFDRSSRGYYATIRSEEVGAASRILGSKEDLIRSKRISEHSLATDPVSFSRLYRNFRDFPTFSSTDFSFHRSFVDRAGNQVGAGSVKVDGQERRRAVAPTRRGSRIQLSIWLSYRSSRGSMNKNDMLTSVVQPAETNSGNAREKR